MDTASTLITPEIIFLLTVASGVWLSKYGKPLNTVISTIHKLIALTAVVFTGLAIYNLLKNAGIPFFVVALMVVAGLCILASVITGALMSLDKPMNNILLTIHKVAPFLAATVMVVTIYLALNGGVFTSQIR